MVADNTRQHNRVSSAITQIDKPTIGRETNGVRTGVIRWLSHLVVEWLGAIEDHRKWINSDRARALGTTFEVSGRLLTYVAYVALAYLAFNSFVDIRTGLTTGMHAIPGPIDGSRVALFNILATGLAGPIAIIAIGVGVGWIYNLTTATANRVLPRFVRPLVHPSILFAIVAFFAAFHSAATQTVARGYLYAKANIEAASPQAGVPVKVIEIPDVDVPSVPEATGHDSSGERELVRLRSMFNSGRPCANEAQGAKLSPQSETARPEPGLAPSRDCQVEITAPHD